MKDKKYTCTSNICYVLFFQINVETVTQKKFMSCLINAELQLLNLSPTVYVEEKGSLLWNNKNVMKTYIGFPSLPYSHHWNACWSPVSTKEMIVSRRNMSVFDTARVHMNLENWQQYP